MAHWTTKQVGEWLKKNGFELLVRVFKDNQIDGASLLVLSDDAIAQILSVQDKHGTKNDVNIEKFKDKLHQWKMEQSGDLSTHRKEHQNSAASTSSVMTATGTNEMYMSGKNTDTSYTKTLTFSADSTRVNVKFFNNPLFCAKLQQYLSQTYNIQCSTESVQQGVILTFIGVKQQVKAGRSDIKSLFESAQTKIYNSEVADRKVLYWSKNIFSDATVKVIQQIMDNEKIFTVWEKTEMFSGYYQVMYLRHECFAVSEEYITQLLNREIAYIENIKMPIEKTKNFINEIEQFILTQKQSELTIIHCKYPYQMEIKVSLFGRKKRVQTMKKHLQLLVNKHTLKAFEIKMTPVQHIFLVDNCLEKLKDIESDYKDDNVQIRIRQKEFYAPQYLIEQIKQHINELICQTAIFVIQKIGCSICPTDEDIEQLNQIATRYYSRIEKVESKNEKQVYSVPKALAKTSLSSKLIVEQSNAFCTSLSVRKLSVLNGSIEIYTAGQCVSISKDVTVVSTDAGAAEERIKPVNDDGFFETTSGRKIVFHRWSLPAMEEDNASAKIKRSVDKFISYIAQSIATNCPDAVTIAFLASEWENFGDGPRLAEHLIIGMKREIETRRSRWRVMFIFNDEQSRLHNEFLQTVIRLQSDEDGFGQFLTSVLTISITVATSKGNNLITCENEINRYIRNNMSTTEILKNASDLKKWDQYMINAFYKYCLEKFVLPKIDLTIYQLQLIGSAQDVEKATQKYKLMSDILKLKSSIRIPPTVVPKSSITGLYQPDSVNSSSYNIAFSYCPHDKAICHRLAAYLLKEGYSICQSLPRVFLSQTQIDKSDLLLIYFSENYSKDIRCMADMNYAKSTGKRIVPIAETKNVLQDKVENSWLCQMTVTGLFYDIFDSDIELEFTGDFDLDYDRILTVLLRHTKPGVTGQLYPQPELKLQTNLIDTDREQALFGGTSMALQKVTDVQRKERNKAYKLKLNQRIEKERIPGDEINMLVGSLILVVEDLEGVLNGDNPDNYIPEDERGKNSFRSNETGYSQVYARELLDCINRWLERAPNVIKKNVTPFTPTGDVNDALFVTYHQSTDEGWWKHDYERFESSLSMEDYFSNPISNQGSWFTTEQADDFFQRILQAVRQTNLIQTKIEDNETAWDTVSISEIDGADIAGDEDEIDVRRKTPEEIQKIQKRDDPLFMSELKRRVAEHFIRRKRLVEERSVVLIWMTKDRKKPRQQSAEIVLKQEQAMMEMFAEQQLQNSIEFQQLCASKIIHK